MHDFSRAHPAFRNCGQTVVMRERVGAIIERDGLILMVRHRAKDSSGRHVGNDYLTLPGGGIEDGETPTDAVAREVAEEVNLHVTHSSFLRRIEHREREHPGATSLFRVAVADGEPWLGSDPELTCDCPRLVGLEWIPAPRRAEWLGEAAWAHLKVRLS